MKNKIMMEIRVFKCSKKIKRKKKIKIEKLLRRVRKWIIIIIFTIRKV